jgi:hypothetical protein
METKLTGEKLLKTAINKILEQPEKWDQSAWHSPCGTKHCIAGWCQILSGNAKLEFSARGDSIKALGISQEEADYLFDSKRTISEIYKFAESFSLNSAGYNRAGYNRDGYDRDGYDRDGYDRAGYDRAGYDRAGYNRDGYDLAGYDLTGYDRDGHNRAGYNRDGYDRAGYNRAGYNRDGVKLKPFEI